MSSPTPTRDTDTAAILSAAFPSSLPMELVLAIIEAAIVQHRADTLSWCLKLSLVCRAARTLVLPIAYEVLYISIPKRFEKEFTGWDNGMHSSAQSAFLSWLLHDPTAPPRRHVKHLILHSNNFTGDIDLVWAGAQTGATSPEWPIEQLTIRDRERPACLHRAGLRPRRAFRLRSTTEIFRVPRAKFADFLAIGCGPGQVWTEEPKLSEDGSFIAKIEQQYATRREIDLITGRRIKSTPPATWWVTIQLYNGDYLHHFPDQLLADLADVFVRRPDIEVVLACSVDYNIDGKTIEEFIHGASEILSVEAVKARLRISHAAWVPRNKAKDIVTALAQAEVRGDNSWDRGRAICQFC